MSVSETGLLRLSRRIKDIEDLPGAGGSVSLTEVGAIALWPVSEAPAGWLICDGSAVSRAAYASLYSKLCRNAGAATITIASPAVVTLSGHGFAEGDSMYFTTGGSLPAGLAVNTLYYVKYLSAETFKLSATRGGGYINTSGTQSGVHTVYACPFGLGDGSTTFNLPNMKGKVAVGKNTSETEFDALGETGGSKTHQLTITEMPAHGHGFTPLYYGNHTAGYSNISMSGTAQASPVVGNTGGDGAHNNLQPYAVLNFIIRYEPYSALKRGEKGGKGERGAQGNQGENAPQVVAGYSADGESWHTAYIENDDYIRFSVDDGNTWGQAVYIRGQHGEQGAVGVSYRMTGVYNEEASYVSNTVYIDCVTYNGSSYYAKQDTSGNLPTDTAYWGLLAQKGMDGSGTGDVVGPSSAVDNAVTRFDSTTGKLIQNSLLTVDDNGSLNIPSGQSYRINGTALAKGDIGLGNVSNNAQVIAPASNTDAKFPQWDGANSKTLKDGYSLSDLMLAMYPVGAIYISVVNTSPATLFGGTWAAFGAGKALVGYASGDSDFGSVEGTGGEKTHTLTSAESGVPAHTHPLKDQGTNNIDANGSWTAGSSSLAINGGSCTNQARVTSNTAANASSAHNNLQPYIVAYMWKRTA